MPSAIKGLLTKVVLRYMHYSPSFYFWTHMSFKSFLRGSVKAYTAFPIALLMAPLNAALALLRISFVTMITIVSGTFPPK